ncbi:MAG: hypothetical protein QG577_1613 [Thermodesulfobacteriota bacterium]|nr:hypothetical protein [Thermodesulfobacteriota bacterium]
MNEHLQQSLKNLSYSLRRYHVDDFYLRHANDMLEATNVLDLGGDRVAKRGAFNLSAINHHVTYANLSPAKSPNVQCRAECVPFKADSFDVVICSEVLEHLLDPVIVLREIFRVLRSQGTALICVPFLNRIHADPFDYGRYTDYYWFQVLAAIGFRDIAIESQGGFWTVLVEMVRYLICDKTMSWGPRRTWLINSLALTFARMKTTAIAWDQDAAEKHDKRDPYGFTTGYGLKAVKP